MQHVKDDRGLFRMADEATAAALSEFLAAAPDQRRRLAPELVAGVGEAELERVLAGAPVFARGADGASGLLVSSTVIAFMSEATVGYITDK